MSDIQNGETLPVPIQAIQYQGMEDAGRIIKLARPFKATILCQNGIGSIDLQMTSLPDSTKTVRLGYWVVNQDRKVFVCTEESFNETYKLVTPEPGIPSYDGKMMYFEGRSISASEEEAMGIALAIGHYIEEKQSKEYERLYAEGQFWRSHICRHRVIHDRESQTPEDKISHETEIEYSLRNAVLVYNEVLSDQTACWNGALIECPDGTSIDGREAIMKVYNEVVLEMDITQ